MHFWSLWVLFMYLRNQRNLMCSLLYLNTNSSHSEVVMVILVVGHWLVILWLVFHICPSLHRCICCRPWCWSCLQLFSQDGWSMDSKWLVRLGTTVEKFLWKSNSSAICSSNSGKLKECNYQIDQPEIYDDFKINLQWKLLMTKKVALLSSSVFKIWYISLPYQISSYNQWSNLTFNEKLSAQCCIRNYPS